LSGKVEWRWLQKLRTCTIFPQRAPLSGKVEVDEFYLGGESHGKRGRGAPHKHKVAIAVERKGRRLGRLRIQVIDNCSAQQLLPFVKNTIASNSGVLTDGWKGYQGLDQSGYRHQALRSCQKEDKNRVLPGGHLVISLIKRFLCGTFQGRFDGAYLQRYLDEYVFRFNRRTCRSVGKRFWRIAQRAASSPPITNIALKLTPS